MNALPQISGREVVAALVKLGYEKDRHKGSHIVLRQDVEHPILELLFPTTRKLPRNPPCHYSRDGINCR